jgi:hypothetical protein
MSGKFLLIYICNFHVLIHLLLIYICKLHWNLNIKVAGMPTESSAANVTLGTKV